MPTTSRTVRLFVSSTFRDMQAERDHLVRFVFPEIEARCAQRGLSFIPVDLRWGVTREEAESGEALTICLEEIERCRPWLLCLLGERYGWRPLPHVVPAPCVSRLAESPEAALFAAAYAENTGFDEHRLLSDRARRQAWGDAQAANEEVLLAALERTGVPHAGESITAREIREGVLRDPDQAKHTLFCFRDPALTKSLAEGGRSDCFESKETVRARLVALKQEIRDAGLKPATYPDLDALGRLVLDELWARIDAEFPQAEQGGRDPLAEEREAHDLFAARLTRFFVGRDELLRELDELTEAPRTEGDSGWVAVTGRSGSGKTAVLANWLYGNDHSQGYADRHPDVHVVAHFIGASARSTNPREILSRLCHELAPIAEPTEDIPGDLDKLCVVFPQLLRAATMLKPVLIVLDALEQLEETGDEPELGWLPPGLPPGATIVVSWASSGPSGSWPAGLQCSDHKALEVPALERATARRVVTEYLAVYRKKLDEEQLDILLGKTDTGSPLYLQVALSELRDFGDFSRLTEYIQALPNTISEMYRFMLEHLEREHSPEFVARVVSCLVCGRYGMTERELIALSEGVGGAGSSLRWSRLLRALSSHLVIRGDVHGFYHRQLHQAARERYLRDPATGRELHRLLARFFEQRPLTDRRKFQEQTWQEVRGELGDEVQKTLMDFHFLLGKVESLGTGELVADFGDALAAELALPADARDALQAIHDAVRLSAHVVSRDTDQFASQLIGRLDPNVSVPVGRFVSDVREQMQGTWIRPAKATLAQPGGALLRLLSGEGVRLMRVVVTPDGRRAVSVSRDGTLLVWDLESGAQLAALPRHVHGTGAVALTPDGRRAVSASRDGYEVKLWDLDRGEELSTLPRQTGEVQAIAFTADGRHAVTTSTDHVIKVLDLSEGRDLFTLAGHTDRISSVAVTSDGQRAVSSSIGEARVWDLQSGEEIHTHISDQYTGLHSVMRDGRRAVSESWCQLKVWDLENGSDLGTVDGYRRGSVPVAVTPDGQRAVSASGKEVVIWDLESGSKLAVLTGHRGDVGSLATTSDGQRAVTGSEDGELKVWDLNRYEESLELAGHAHGVKAVAVTTDGRRVVSASASEVKIWNLECGGELRTLPGQLARDSGIALLPHGRSVLAVSQHYWLRVLDLERGETRLTLAGHNRGVNSVAVTQDARLAVSASDDHTLKVWDLERGEERWALTGHCREVTAVAALPDGRRAISGSYDGTLRVWDMECGKLLHVLTTGRKGGVHAIAVTPDGRRAVSVRSSKTWEAVTWDLESGQELRSLTGRNLGSGGAILTRSVAISPDGRRATCTSSDGLRSWDLDGQGELRTAAADAGPSVTGALTPDGRRAICPSAEGMLEVWDLQRGVITTMLAGHASTVVSSAMAHSGRLAVTATRDGEIKVWDLERNRELRSMPGHGPGLTQVAVTPDGRRAISLSDEVAKVWDLERGQMIQSLPGHFIPWRQVALAPDGRCAVVVSDAHCINLVETESGGDVLTLAGHHRGPVSAIAVAADGRRAVSASADRTLKVWDLERGREISTLAGHSEPVAAVEVTPDGRRAVSASGKEARVWDLERGVELRALSSHTNRSHLATALTPDGRYALVAVTEYPLKLLDLHRGNTLQRLTGHSDKAYEVSVTSDGSRAVSSGWDGALRVWDLERGQEVHALATHGPRIDALAVSPEGNRAATASPETKSTFDDPDRATVETWDLERGVRIRSSSGYGEVAAVALTADGRTLAVTTERAHETPSSLSTVNYTLKIWDTERRTELGSVTGHPDEPGSVAVTHDGRRLITVSGDHMLRVWSVQRGSLGTDSTGHSSTVNAVAITPDGRRAVSASDDATLRVWDLERCEGLLTLAGHEMGVSAVVVTPDGQRAVSGSQDGRLKIWDLQSGEEVRTLYGEGDPKRAVAVTPDGKQVVSSYGGSMLAIRDLDQDEEPGMLPTVCFPTEEGCYWWIRALAVAVTPDGRRAVFGSDDKALRVCDLNSCEVLCKMTGHTDHVRSVSVMSDGRRALSGSRDGTLKLWDLERGAETATFLGHTDHVWAVAITPDDRWAVSASSDHTLKLWDIERGMCVATFTADAGLSACAIGPDGLTVVAGDSSGRIHFLKLEGLGRHAR